MFRWLGYFFLGLDKHGWSIFRNFRKFGTRDLTVEVANAFVESVAIEEEGYLKVKESDVISFAEQIVYRTIECRKCLVESKCDHCTCYFPSKMITPEQKCPNGEWLPIMNAEEWEAYKEKTNVSQFIIKSAT